LDGPGQERVWGLVRGEQRVFVHPLRSAITAPGL
jgi:hypothetical protein